MIDALETYLTGKTFELSYEDLCKFYVGYLDGLLQMAGPHASETRGGEQANGELLALAAERAIFRWSARLKIKRRAGRCSRADGIATVKG